MYTLALFFTRHISLKLWVDTGLFDREKQLYEEHLRRGHLQKVYWLTYGRNDTEIADRLKANGRLHPDIIVLSMPRFFHGKRGHLFYSLLMPLVHRHCLKSVDILKTNQMDGSWSAVIAKWLYKKPIIVRTGYMASLFMQRQSNSKPKKKLYEWMERFAYRNADIGVVASHKDKQYLRSTYQVPEEKINVLGNYIDTGFFCPTNCEKYQDRLIFVGRLNSQKNLFNLVEAVSDNNLILDIYGNGELYDELLAQVKKLKAKVNFMGVIDNDQLPGVLNRYRYYILPSFYEGMPKTLLEAMACGLVCIGTNVEGINEIIEDGVNGYLAESTDVKALSEVIIRAVKSTGDSVTKEAMEKINKQFSLDIIVEKERKIFDRLDS